MNSTRCYAKSILSIASAPFRSRRSLSYYRSFHFNGLVQTALVTYLPIQPIIVNVSVFLAFEMFCGMSSSWRFPLCDANSSYVSELMNPLSTYSIICVQKRNPRNP